MDITLKKSIRNGIYFGLIPFLGFMIFFTFLQIQNNTFSFGMFLFSIWGSFMGSVYYILAAIVASLIFYYFKDIKKK